MSMVQLNTRMESTLKGQGDAVFQRFGYTPSQAVRALWSYAAQQQNVPPFMGSALEDEAAETPRERALRGFGLVTRLAQAQGLELALDDARDFAALEDAMYDDMLDEYEANHV